MEDWSWSLQTRPVEAVWLAVGVAPPTQLTWPPLAQPTQPSSRPDPPPRYSSAELRIYIL